MAKNKLKSLDKAARKSVRETIKSSLIADLKELTGELGTASKKLEKEILKGSKKLAKRLTREIKVNQETGPEMRAEPQRTNIPKATPAKSAIPPTTVKATVNPASKKPAANAKEKV